MTNAFFRVLRKEKELLVTWTIIQFIMVVCGQHISDAIIVWISYFIVLTVAHDEYGSRREKICCILLACLLLVVTIFAGVNVYVIVVRIVSAILAGLAVSFLRRLIKNF